MPPIFQYVDDVEKQTMKIWKKVSLVLWQLQNSG